MVRRYSFAGLAGCVQIKKARQTGMRVGVYHSEQSGMEVDPELPWSTVCEEHGSIVSHPTRDAAVAHAADPQGWCEECREPKCPSCKKHFAVEVADDGLERCRNCGVH